MPSVPQPQLELTAWSLKTWSRKAWGLLLVSLTAMTVLVHGYHPFAEDGGVYAAGIYLKLDPTLFPRSAEFVREPMRYSAFASLMAAFAHLTHLSVPWSLFLADLFSTWLMLYAAHQILKRCFPSHMAQLGGIVLLAAWWTLPIAGTSLVLMDPYVTARSFSTPLALLAIAMAMEPWHSEKTRPLRYPAVLCALCLGCAAAMHLLMAGYALAFVIAVWICRARQFRILVIFGGCAIAAAFLVQKLASPESPASRMAGISRYYWFLSQWQWYEITGLFGPMAIFLWLYRRPPTTLTTNVRTLCLSSLAMGAMGALVALLFAHESSAHYAVARLQPLRVYLTLYAIMAMLLGAIAAEKLDRTKFQVIPFVCFAALATIMGFVQHQTYSASAHLEFPWRTATDPNPWVRAFLWAQENTSRDALFAMDAHYITSSGEDAETFRAFALRDTLPDYSKDGGEAAIAPNLAEDWQQGVQTQLELEQATDSQRRSKLQPFQVTWLLLHSKSSTSLPCPYDNGSIKICRLSAL